jgi:peptidoglycan/xylan/chitin deacetylase (PgdA/CDA1 family)
VSVSVAVAVCARAGAEVQACCEALDRAGEPDPIVVRAAPGQGLAVARNEGLARCDAEVIAYVDDDVLVPAGWLQALVAAWEAAPPTTGAIGGPIEAAWCSERPAWLTDDLLIILGVSASPQPSAPESRERTLLGGNLSFRAPALRGVGAFWPVRGHPRARDWFTEEHEAQRELRRAGWTVSEEPALLAARALGAVRPAELLARRARSGARSSVVGVRRPPTTAVRSAVVSAVGVAAAGVRGDGVRAVARGARSAEHLGGLAGALAVHGELQPVARRTPFRHTIAPPQPSPLRAAGRRLRRPSARVAPLVLVYHRVAAPGIDPLGLAVSPARLAADLELARKHRTPVALEDIALGRAPDDAVAVTFDDGYADVLIDGLPALERAGVPATVFVSTGHVDEGRPFWWDELHTLLRRAAPAAGEPLRLNLEGGVRAWPARTAPERATAFMHLKSWLQPLLPEVIDVALDTVASWAQVPRGGAAQDRPLTRDELRRLAASPLIAIGSHTRTHPSLAFATPERRRAELERSRTDLEAWLGAPPEAFSYPYGVLGIDVDRASREAVACAGYRFAVRNDAGAPHDDLFLLPRSSPERLRAWSPPRGRARWRS